MGGKVVNSPINDIALKCVSISDVELFDTTLRDGVQAPGISLSTEDKIAIARSIDEMGVDSIEVGFPASGKTEKETIKRIKDLGLNAKLYALARCIEEDVDAVIECGIGFVHMFIATSDIHLRYKLKKKRSEIIGIVRDTVSYAKQKGLRVMFSCEDATRTDIGFLKQVFGTAVDSGAEIIDVADTVGIAVPRALSYIVKELRKEFDVPLSVHCHNDLGLAVANSLAAVEAGARMVHVCVNGMGERAGNTPLEELAVCISVNYNLDLVDLKRIGAVSKMVSRYTGYPLAYNKPVVGRNAFAHESGIHVHGMMNNSHTYEAYPPETVGRDRIISIGRYSGEHSVRGRLESLGIDFPETLMEQLMSGIKEIAFTGKEINDLELAAIAENTLWKGRTADDVKMKEFVVVTGKNVTPTATITVDVKGDVRTCAATGNGPVDATYNAIFELFDGSYQVVDFRLEAITGGSDSLCEVTIMIMNTREGNRVSVGKSVGLDIVDTSADAIMEAINRDCSS